MKGLRRRVSAYLPPVAFGLIGLVLWESVLRLTDPRGFVLPPPTEIVAALFDNWSRIWVGTRHTGYVIVTGLAVGVVLGVIGALLVTRFRSANETITPVATAVNAIPIVALAPVFNAWFGLISPRSNQAVVIVLVFFPVFINVTKGLTQVQPSQIELMRSYAAKERTITREVRIPNAMPFFFNSLKIVSSLSVIAAIVAEYFGGRQDALGPMIIQSAGLTRYDDAWAAVFASAMIGIALYALAALAERLAMPWHASVRETAL